MTDPTDRSLPREPRLRILLVDDHPVVRHGLKAMFAERPDMDVVAEAADGRAALDALTGPGTRGAGVDIVLMDLRMGTGMDGVTAIRHITELDSPPPVLVLTTYDTDADILAAVEAGATGYMLKDAPPEQLCEAVHAAARGQTALAPGVANRLMDRLRSPRPALSGRELEILGLLAEGLSNRAISRELFISEATVKTHLVHVFDKLGVDNRTAAITTALQRGIIRVD
ncbi:response regulator transcription factor [Nocardiopsis metallicus]|uniref:DNA-binding NarL/FixJ family response regulator n=1 Tax=Nocardiopsis metallicus TaxID=179819 RepID=A0A840WAM4_9ACTN|nr:response regulator transcription factor [Nocardiopsis metallicus]MBB5492443.1 DNA-binding NarL/FixJ family response regulator [Nocardiopsis metallicus]